MALNSQLRSIYSNFLRGKPPRIPFRPETRILWTQFQFQDPVQDLDSCTRSRPRSAGQGSKTRSAAKPPHGLRHPGADQPYKHPPPTGLHCAGQPGFHQKGELQAAGQHSDLTGLLRFSGQPPAACHLFEEPYGRLRASRMRQHVRF